MSELVELIFEDVPKEYVAPLFELIVNGSSIISFDNDENAISSGVEWSLRLMKVLSAPSQASFCVIANRIVLDNVGINDALIRVLKYEDVFDVRIEFKESAISSWVNVGDVPILNLQTAASKIAKTFSPKAYFCGYEPAEDEKTRFFTGEILGPVLSSK